ncbi:MAG: hypothetical protein AAFY71_16585 [Bacteroidota bacterium]
MNHILIVHDSWNMSYGILANLRKEDVPLMPGQVLESRETQLRWVVVSRIMFMHAYAEQKRFWGEHESLTHFSFRSFDVREASKLDILQKESDGIFQYKLQALNHEDKPEVGDELMLLEGLIHPIQYPDPEQEASA